MGVRLVLRHPVSSDLAPLARLAAEYERRYAGEAETTEADLREDWRRIDPASDAWVAELGGRIAAYGALMDRSGKAVLDCYVDPELAGLGCGTAIVAVAEARAHARGAPAVQGWALYADEQARALFLARGYREVRHFLRMATDLPPAPPEPVWPEGIEVGTAVPGEERLYYETVARAFEHEWDFRYDFDGWLERRLAEGLDHSLLLTARAGGELVGVAQCALRRGGGWIGSLGVLPEWRRRGLGSALLAHAIRTLAERDVSRVALAVDTENPSGAARLYERAGMRAVWRAAIMEKELRP